MPIQSSGIPRLAEIAASSVREHGSDWQSVRCAIEEALAQIPIPDREAIDAEIAANDGLISSTVDKLGH